MSENTKSSEIKSLESACLLFLILFVLFGIGMLSYNLKYLSASRKLETLHQELIDKNIYQYNPKTGELEFTSEYK